MKNETTLVRIPALDGLRGLAALVVFIPHFLNRWNAQDAHAGFGPVLRTVYDLRGYGGLGVDVFFVLSGFLISSLLIADRRSETFFNDFYWKRALRILPVYFVHLMATLVFYRDGAGYVLLCMVFLVNFADPLHVKAPGQGWTLSIEEQFYLLWPQAVRRLKERSLYALAFGLVASANVLRLVVPLVHGGANERFTFYRTDGLALGALVAFERFLPVEDDRVARGILRFLQSNWTLAGAIALAVAAGAYGNAAVMQRQLVLTAANLAFYRMIRWVVFARGSVSRGKAIAWLGSPALVWLGGISYALYMYQGFVIYGFERVFGLVSASHEGAVLLRGALVLMACFVVCTASKYAIELPAQRLRRFVVGRRAAAVVEAPLEVAAAHS